MTFPEGVQTATLTFSNPIGFVDGKPATRTEVTVQPSAAVVWSATGEPIEPYAEKITPAPGMPGWLTVPFVDQAGFTDQMGNAFTMWAYTVTRRAHYGNEVRTVTKYWQPLVGQNSVDFDNLPGGSIGLPLSVPIPPVISVAGLTLTVGAEDLAGALVPFLPESASPEDVAAAVAPKLDAAERGAANGVAPLDSGSKVPDANLPTRLGDAALSATILNQLPTTGKAATIPAGLGWDADYPLAITLTDLPGTSRSFGAVDKTPEQLFDAASTARSAPGATFYVSGTGVNTNDGLTTGTAVRSIWKGIELANAAAVPSKVIVAAGKYIRSHNIWSSGATGYPTVDIALIADGGRVVTGSFDDAGTPTVDATHTNTYSWAVANCNKVVDMANLNRYGNFTELVKVTTAAECNVIPNSWALVAGILYVNRADRQAVTTATTRIYRPSSNGLALRKAVNFYMGGTTGNDGWDIEGGNNIGVFDITVNPANNPYTGKFVCVVKNSTFKYGGGVTDTIVRAVSVEGWNGLAAFFNCRADAAQSDGFNFHNVYAAVTMNVLTINCTGYDNGRYPQPSCNGWTAHENVKGIDIAGHYRDSRGGTVRNINSSKMLAIGTWCDGDFGDVPHGGSVAPTAYRMDDTAQLWADRTKATGAAGGYGYFTGAAGASIHKRAVWPTPSPDHGLGTFDTY